MKIVYCANCGTRLNVKRKAMPKYGTIIDLVEFHECSEEPVELDLKPVDVPVFNSTEGKDKFIQKLDQLQPPASLGAISTNDLRDRRKGEFVKDSTAPASLEKLIRPTNETN